jgi:hypothetical protein
LTIELFLSASSQKIKPMKNKTNCNTIKEHKMSKQTALKIIFALLSALQFSAAKAESCDSTFNDAANWLAEKEPGYNRYVGFLIAGIKAPAKFLSYGVGGLQLVQGPGRLAPIKYLKGKDIDVTFSDRTWCPEIAPGSFCTGYQAFNYHAKDTQQLYIYDNNTAKIVLTTWGNATYTIPLTCSNGFLYGTMAEPNGNSMVVVSLNKGKIAIPR